MERITYHIQVCLDEEKFLSECEEALSKEMDGEKIDALRHLIGLARKNLNKARLDLQEELSHGT